MNKQDELIDEEFTPEDAEVNLEEIEANLKKIKKAAGRSSVRIEKSEKSLKDIEARLAIFEKIVSSKLLLEGEKVLKEQFSAMSKRIIQHISRETIVTEVAYYVKKIDMKEADNMVHIIAASLDASDEWWELYKDREITVQQWVDVFRRINKTGKSGAHWFEIAGGSI